jgi:hypothetical protein
MPLTLSSSSGRQLSCWKRASSCSGAHAPILHSLRRYFTMLAYMHPQRSKMEATHAQFDAGACLRAPCDVMLCLRRHKEGKVSPDPTTSYLQLLGALHIQLTGFPPCSADLSDSMKADLERYRLRAEAASSSSSSNSSSSSGRSTDITVSVLLPRSLGTPSTVPMQHKVACN